MELFGQICWWIAAGLTVLAAPVALWHLLRGLRGLFPMLARPVRRSGVCASLWSSAPAMSRR